MQRYAVHRDIWLDEDIDGSWLVGVVRPEEPEIRGDRKGGSTRINDPAVTGFLRELFALLAAPDHYGDRDISAPARVTEAVAAGCAGDAVGREHGRSSSYAPLDAWSL